MTIAFTRLVKKRAIWLAALFLGEMLTATAMAYFVDEIARAVVLALFVPLIISSGGNSGSQASTLVIRAMALGEIKLRDWWRVIRRELAAKHPWLPAAVLKAFSQAKTKCLEALEETSASKVTLPFVEEQLRAARALMGEDFWSYGLAPNRRVLETFLRHHHAQGLSPRLISPEELFHPSTHESFAI